MSVAMTPPAPPVSRDTASRPVPPTDAPRPAAGLPRSLGPARARVGVLFVAYLVVGATACGIFDRFVPSMVLAPMLPTIGALAFAPRSGLFRVTSAIAAVVMTGVIAVIGAGGGASDVVDAFTSGFQGLLSTEWPSPDRPDLIGTVAIVLATGTAVSAELATRRRFHLLPLTPLVITYAGALALSAPLGVNWLSLIALCLLATVFATIRNEGSLRDRFVTLRGERRLIPLLIVVAVFGALLTLPLTLSDRADPRRADPPEQSATLLDPIEATLALRDLDPPIDLHVVTPNDGGSLPLRWRTAALEDYDGNRWTPELTLRPIGRTLGPVTGPTVDADISFLDDDLSLVPLPGAPVTVDARVETDADRTVVRLLDRPTVGDIVPVVANRAPTRDDVLATTVTGRLVGDDVSSLTELATALAGEGSPLEQLTRLEATMRDDWVRDEAVAGGGLQRAFLELFLRDTQRGNTEQFVTGFVLLARSLGIEARVATGFVAASNAPEDGGLVLSSSEASVWPEVGLDDGTWFAFDPVPEEEASDVAPPPPQPETQTPAAPQPPIAPPPDPDTENTPIETPDTTDSTGTLSAAIEWAVRAGVFAGLILLPFLVAAGLILGTKHRRRKRRLTAPAATDRIRGAWASATDALVDAGLSIRQSSTDAQIATDGEPIVADARRELRRLATMSSAATFGSPRQSELLADDAARCLVAVEQTLVAGRTRRQQLRWRLSVRSLRAATRSPVTD